MIIYDISKYNIIFINLDLNIVSKVVNTSYTDVVPLWIEMLNIKSVFLI